MSARWSRALPRAVVVSPDPETRLLARRALWRAGIEATFHGETPDDAELAAVDVLVLGAGAERGRTVARAVEARGGRVVSVLRASERDAMGAQAVIRGPMSVEGMISAIAQAVGMRRRERGATEQRRREAALV